MISRLEECGLFLDDQHVVEFTCRLPVSVKRSSQPYDLGSILMFHAWLDPGGAS
jgi:hypothetical protein